MAGRTDTRFSFQLRILLLLLGSCWLLAGTFMVFQYHREKEYKTGMMNTRLQMHNARLLDDLRKGEPIGNIVGRISSPTENLRHPDRTRRQGDIRQQRCHTDIRPQHPAGGACCPRQR